MVIYKVKNGFNVYTDLNAKIKLTSKNVKNFFEKTIYSKNPRNNFFDGYVGFLNYELLCQLINVKIPKQQSNGFHQNIFYKPETLIKIRKIIEIGHPALREVAKAVPKADIASKGIQRLVDDLIDTMRYANGAGLAATQIAVPLRVCVIEVNKNPRYPYKPDIPLTVLINPKITFLTDKRITVYEGCLSVPNLRGQVERCPEIRVEGLDRSGSSVNFVSKGISAGTFQHELDHLDGLIFTDHLKDASSLSTLEEFAVHHEAAFKEKVMAIVEQYGS